MLRVLIFGALSAAGLFFAAKAGAKMQTMSGSRFGAIYEKWGAQYSVDPLLLRAIAIVESSENPEAINAADRFSVGLMQILYKPRTELDLDAGPSNRFDVEGWGIATFSKLKDPDYNVQIGAQILAWNIRTFGMPRAVAVYNAWDQRREPLNGPFKNQQYVDRVLTHYNALKGTPQ